MKKVYLFSLVLSSAFYFVSCSEGNNKGSAEDVVLESSETVTQGTDSLTSEALESQIQVAQPTGGSQKKPKFWLMHD